MEQSMLSKLSLPKGKVGSMKPKVKIPHHKTGEKFLKGPIPLNWLCRAAQLPGKSLHVANAIWFLVGLNNSPIIKLNQAILNKFGVSRHCKYRALNWLSDAGLVSVAGANGKNPIVTVLEFMEEKE